MDGGRHPLFLIIEYLTSALWHLPTLKLQPHKKMSDTNTDPNSPQKAGCQREPCSPSSDTPETDAALVDGMPEPEEWSQHYLNLAIHARRMERERDILRRKADNLHLSISVFLGDWRAGDFRLPELATIHMSAIEEKYRALGKVLFDMENVNMEARRE